MAGGGGGFAEARTWTSGEALQRSPRGSSGEVGGEVRCRDFGLSCPGRGGGRAEVTGVRRFAQCQAHGRGPGGSVPHEQNLVCPLAIPSRGGRCWEGEKGRAFACITRLK